MTNPFSTEWAWLKAHERLILILAGIVVLFFGYHKYLAYRDAADIRNDNLAHAQLQSSADKNAVLAAQAKQQADDYKTLVVQMQDQNNRLITAISAREVATKQQQQRDQVLPPDQLAARIQILAPGGTVAPQPDATYKIDQPEAVSIVQKLDLIAPLQQDLKDEQAISANKDAQLDKVNGFVTTLNEQVGGLQQELHDTGYIDKKGSLECQGGACQADIKVAVNKEAKKHRKWEILLTIAGFVLGRKF
jgi:hypothetical protein